MLTPPPLATNSVPTQAPTSLAPTPKTRRPDFTPYPSKRPTKTPTQRPTTGRPTKMPVSMSPTTAPTAPTTLAPTKRPTTLAPTRPTLATTSPTTAAPTFRPTTLNPTRKPTKEPTLRPTRRPTTDSPTTSAPTLLPSSLAPTSYPTYETPSPTMQPTMLPTFSPTLRPLPPSQILAVGAGVSATVAFFTLFACLCFCWRKLDRSRKEKSDTVVVVDVVPIQSVSPSGHHYRESDVIKKQPVVKIPKSASKKTPKQGGKRMSSVPQSASPDDIESQKLRKGSGAQQAVVPYSLAISQQPQEQQRAADVGYSGRSMPPPVLPPTPEPQGNAANFISFDDMLPPPPPLPSGKPAPPPPREGGRKGSSTSTSSSSRPNSLYFSTSLPPVSANGFTSGRSSLPPPLPTMSGNGKRSNSQDIVIAMDEFGSQPPPPLPPSRAPASESGSGGGFMAQMIAMLPRRVSSTESTQRGGGSATTPLASASMFSRIPNRKASTSSWASERSSFGIDGVEEKSDEPPPRSTAASTNLSKYERMHKAGIPVDAIKHAMTKDGVPHSAFPGLGA